MCGVPVQKIVPHNYPVKQKDCSMQTQRCQFYDGLQATWNTYPMSEAILPRAVSEIFNYNTLPSHTRWV